MGRKTVKMSVWWGKNVGSAGLSPCLVAAWPPVYLDKWPQQGSRETVSEQTPVWKKCPSAPQTWLIGIPEWHWFAYEHRENRCFERCWLFIRTSGSYGSGAESWSWRNHWGSSGQPPQCLSQRPALNYMRFHLQLDRMSLRSLFWGWNPFLIQQMNIV